MKRYTFVAAKAPARTVDSAEILERKVVAGLSLLDRFLPVWILLAMAAGLLLGRLAPGVVGLLDAGHIGSTSLPIAIGLLLMMYPVLAKVRYAEVGAIARQSRLLVPSLILNWIVGPALMFGLAWLFLPDLPTYRTGLIIVGLARCIAMVLIWNDLACGDREAAALLVALNSNLQVLSFAFLGWLYLDALPAWLHLGDGTIVAISPWSIAGSVLIFLGIPLVADFSRVHLGNERAGGFGMNGRFCRSSVRSHCTDCCLRSPSFLRCKVTRFSPVRSMWPESRSRS
jgi:ACR3 family arsenite transporter